MLRVVQILREFYAAGVMPRNWTAIKGEEVNTWMQTGRVAMTISSFGRTQFFNARTSRRIPGRIKVMAMPAAREMQAKFPRVGTGQDRVLVDVHAEECAQQGR
jgi:multiple sugar transport system substrate-binding protein